MAGNYWKSVVWKLYTLDRSLVEGVLIMLWIDG